MYLVRLAEKMEKELRAIDSLVSKPKKKMQNGMIIPPPPIPAAFDMARMIGKSIIPANSFSVIGKIDL